MLIKKIIYMKKIFTLIALIAILVSCGNKSDEQLESEIASGVVLVQNQSYYEVVLSNGESIYFSSYDEKDGIKGFSTDKDSVEVLTSYGTGFFISDRGEIVSNAHVVSNMVSDKDVNKSVSSLILSLKRIFAALYNETEETYNKAVAYYNYANVSDDVSYEEFYKIRDYRDAIKQKTSRKLNFLDRIDRKRGLVR